MDKRCLIANAHRVKPRDASQFQAAKKKTVQGANSLGQEPRPIAKQAHVAPTRTVSACDEAELHRRVAVAAAKAWAKA